MSCESPLFLFVRPPRPLWPFNSPASAFWPPLAFASMAAMLRLRLRDLRVGILDAPALEMGWKTLTAELRRRQPAYVGIGEEAVSCVEGLRLARLAKAVGARVIAGGCFFGQVAREVLATGLVDVVVHGEGEQTVVELVQALQDGSVEALSRVAGISYAPARIACLRSSGALSVSAFDPRVNGAASPSEEVWSLRSPMTTPGVVRETAGPCEAEVVTTAPRPLLEDLDALPFPAYDLLPVERYGARSRNHPHLAAIELGRGCFGCCDFCVLWRQMGRFTGERVVPHLRTKSPERLLEEVRVLVRRYGRRYLGWVDPCFNADPRVPGELAERVLQAGLEVGQSAWMRTDALARDARSGALAQTVRAGLNEVYLGLERPDPESLRRLGKTSGLQSTREAMSILREQFPEVLAIGSFIYGLPGDSPETVWAIHRLALELELDQFFFIPLTPLPGTPGWHSELWDPSGERFREFSFLPTGRPHGRHAALERALLLSTLFNWPPARRRLWWRQWLGGDARRRRVHRRLCGRAARFHLGLLFRQLAGGAAGGGMIFPRWYNG